ncbi:hypothetical protein HQ576_18925, partial [bacterium]|nr:hypothetical protein [bacterium]
MRRMLIVPLALLAVAYAGEAPTPSRTHFAFTLPKAAPRTSAGVYDVQGHLVRQLWAMKPLAAGSHTGVWYGKDAFGKPSPAVTYRFRVVANRSTYRN